MVIEVPHVQFDEIARQEWYAGLPCLTEQQRKEVMMERVISSGSDTVKRLDFYVDPDTGDTWWWTGKEWLRGVSRDRVYNDQGIALENRSASK